MKYIETFYHPKKRKLTYYKLFMIVIEIIVFGTPFFLVIAKHLKWL